MFILNENQNYVVEQAVNWFKYSDDLVFQYSGKAGTGKSVVLNEIIRRLNLSMSEILPMSFTGTAALVMRNKGLITAKTIHSSIYEPYEQIKYDEYGKPEMDTYFNKPKTVLRFRKRQSLDGIKLILIDEASMTPRKMKEDIESFGVKVIACGDLNQLPPVGDDPAYLVNGEIHILNQIMRQAESSGIVYLADRAINNLPIHYGAYNNAFVISENELNDHLWTEANIILTCKNKTRDMINKQLQLLMTGQNRKLPLHGEPLICRKNNWEIETDGINLVNGLRGRVNNFPDITAIDNTHKTFNIDFMVGGNTLFKDVKCDYEYYKAPFDARNSIRNSRYGEGNKFELAYAITTHLSQGSQYYQGIFIEEFLNRDIMQNLIYTGITRFSNSMIYVKQSRKFF